MKLALIGNGKMGTLVESMAAARGLEVVARFSSERPLSSNGSRGVNGADVGVDFSLGESVPATVRAAGELGLNLVVGTTGWHDRLDEVRRSVESSGVGLVYGSNFSVGANLFYRCVEQAAALFAAFEAYDPFIQEAHHRFKHDSPSGTALELRRRVESAYVGADRSTEIPTTSLRAGFIPGTHAVGFDSEVDSILLEHRARSREGFASGALTAARWIQGKKGFYSFQEALEDLARNGLNNGERKDC